MTRQQSLRWMLGFAILAPAALGASIGWACGGGAPVPPTGTPPEQMPYTAAYQMLVMWSGDSFDSPTTITVSADIYNPTDGFGYVVPIPQAIDADDLQVMDTGVIDALAAFTGPREVTRACADFRPDVELVCPDPRASTGGEGEGEGEWGGEPVDGVTVETVVVGDYEVALLNAEDTTGLTTWLTENDFALPAASIDHIDSYIELGYSFAAVRVPPGTAVAEGSSLPSLSFSLSEGLRTLPMLLGASAAQTDQDVIVYTHAPEIGNIGISNLAQASVDTHCMATGNAYSDYSDYVFAEQHRTAETAIWALEFYQHHDQYSEWNDSTSMVALTDDQMRAIDSVFESDYYLQKLGRLHIRYSPGQLLYDPAFYATGLTDFQALEYYTWNEELTQYIDTCGVGRTYEGSCPETVVDDQYCEDGEKKTGCSTAATAPSPLGSGVWALCIALGVWGVARGRRE